MNWLFYLAAIGAGIANPMQAGANAQLRKSTGDAIFSAMVVYGSGLLSMAIVQVCLRQTWLGGNRLVAVPWWAWLGGLLSLVSTLAAIMLAQRLGAGLFTGITLTASLSMSVVLDQFGWIGFEPHPASWPRMFGCALMILGILLVARF